MAEQDENVKRALEAGNAAKARSQEEFAKRTKGKPTPTQEENDRAALGEHILEHEPDGAELDENIMSVDMDHQRRQSQAKPGGAPYQTRQATPAKPPST
jgi:hypothetical protein